jgi:hypothetical protein
VGDRGLGTRQGSGLHLREQEEAALGEESRCSAAVENFGGSQEAGVEVDRRLPVGDVETNVVEMGSLRHHTRAEAGGLPQNDSQAGRSQEERSLVRH